MNITRDGISVHERLSTINGILLISMTNRFTFDHHIELQTMQVFSIVLISSIVLRPVITHLSFHNISLIWLHSYETLSIDLVWHSALLLLFRNTNWEFSFRGFWSNINHVIYEEAITLIPRRGEVISWSMHRSHDLGIKVSTSSVCEMRFALVSTVEIVENGT